MSSLAKAALRVVLSISLSVSANVYKNDTEPVYEYGGEDFPPAVNVA